MTLNATPEVLLSVCIPTYNRAEWLRASLQAWLPQTSKAGCSVQVIVSDNCSTDHTQQVIEQAQARGDFLYNRNETNIGGNPNYHKCAELATGKFVWIVGDDDLPRPDAVERVLTAIQSHPTIDLFYVNQSLRVSDETSDDLYTVPTLTSKTLLLDPCIQDRYLEYLMDLMPGDYSCFGSIYSTIMRRDDVISAYSGSLNLIPFSNVASVSSHALYIADHFLYKPAYYIGYPCIHVSTDCSWPQYHPVFFLKIIPDLYDSFEKAGVDRKVMDKYRIRLFPNVRPLLRNMIFDKTTIGREQFVLKEYVLRHWHLWEFHLLILKFALRVVTPKPIRKFFDIRQEKRNQNRLLMQQASLLEDGTHELNDRTHSKAA